MARSARSLRRSRRPNPLLHWLLRRFWGIFEPRPSRRPRMTMEGLEQRMLMSADLVPEIGVFVSSDPLIPGVHVTVPVTVSNAGADGAPGGSIIRLFASEDEVLDASDLVVSEVALPATGLSVGEEQTVDAALDLGGLEHPGTYRLIALADAADAVIESNEGNNAQVSGAFGVAWQFGHLPGQALPVALTLANAAGDRFDVVLAGAGRGSITLGASGLNLSLLGVDGTTQVTIRGRDPATRLALDSISVDGPIGVLDAGAVTLTGDLVATGNVGTLKL